MYHTAFLPNSVDPWQIGWLVSQGMFAIARMVLAPYT